MTYWDRNEEDYAVTLGGADAITRVIVRNHILANRYTSVLDFGCGMAMDAEPLMNSGVYYSGFEASNRFRKNVRTCSPKLPQINDNHFDFAYCRHVLEHLEKDEMVDAVRGMVRVARHGVAIVLAQPTISLLEDEIGQYYPDGREPDLKWNRWSARSIIGAACSFDESALFHNTQVAESGQGRGGQNESIIWIELKP